MPRDRGAADRGRKIEERNMIKGTDCLCFLGDSITEGVGTAKRYIDYIAEETGAEVHGYGVNGAQSVDLFAQIGRMQKETDGCFDILFVCIGTNDYNAGVPFGEFFTEAAETVVCGYDGNGNAVKTALRKKRSFVFDEHTFKGRLNNLFAFLKNEYPDKRIVLLTPLHRAYAFFGGDNVQPNELYANAIGEYFDSYVNAVRQAADIWAVELIDLYRESGLFPLNDKHAEMYFNKSSEDSLHPNAAGHDKIARAILRRI